MDGDSGFRRRNSTGGKSYGSEESFESSSAVLNSSAGLSGLHHHRGKFRLGGSKKQSKKEAGYSSFCRQSSEEELMEPSKGGSGKGKIKKLKKLTPKSKSGGGQILTCSPTHKDKGGEAYEPPKGLSAPLPPKKGGKKLGVHRGSKKEHQGQGDRRLSVPRREVIGVSLQDALNLSRSYDGVPIPGFVRQCLDCVERSGLSLEGIYRISGTKSWSDQLRESLAENPSAKLDFPDPHHAASFLKLFLRELPEPLLTKDNQGYFERAANDASLSEDEKVELMKKLFENLPPANHTLLAYIFLHMEKIIKNAPENRMSLKNIGLMLWSTLSMDQNLLNFFLNHTPQVFGDTEIKTYSHPLDSGRHLKYKMPNCTKELREELLKQETLLNELHESVAQGLSDENNQLWEVQQIVTSLRRKLKQVVKEEKKTEQDVMTPRSESEGPCIEVFEEKQLWAIQHQLRDQIAKEKEEIRVLEQKIRDLEMVPPGPPLPTESDANSPEFVAEMRALEKERDELLTRIMDVRHDCAHYQAGIELLNLKNDPPKELVTTRL